MCVFSQGWILESLKGCKMDNQEWSQNLNRCQTFHKQYFPHYNYPTYLLSTQRSSQTLFTLKRRKTFLGLTIS